MELKLGILTWEIVLYIWVGPKKKLHMSLGGRGRFYIQIDLKVL